MLTLVLFRWMINVLPILFYILSLIISIETLRGFMIISCSIGCWGFLNLLWFFWRISAQQSLRHHIKQHAAQEYHHNYSRIVVWSSLLILLRILLVPLLSTGTRRLAATIIWLVLSSSLLCFSTAHFINYNYQ